LISQHQKNARYHFLKPIDPRFTYFQKLVTAYNECIVLHKDMMSDLEKDLDFDTVHSQALGQAIYSVERENERKQLEADNAANEMAMKLIDWHDFAIVETITFDEDNEYYPAPGKDVEAINQLLDMENRKEINVVLAEDVASDMEVDMDVEDAASSDEEEIVKAPEDGADQVQKLPTNEAPKPPSEPAPKPYGTDTIVTADVDQDITLETEENRQLRLMLEKELFTNQPQSGQFTKCPVTGQMVETSRLSEHIRISLLDPQWKQSKEALIKRMQVTSLAHDQDIVANLNMFKAKHDTQFGVQESVAAGNGSAPDDARIREAREQQRLREQASAAHKPSGGEPPSKKPRI